MCKKKAELVDEISPLATHTLTFQKQPYTVVVLELEYGDGYYVAVGFTKVCYPDKWNADYGVQLAASKALHSLARQVMETEDAPHLMVKSESQLLQLVEMADAIGDGRLVNAEA